MSNVADHREPHSKDAPVNEPIRGHDWPDSRHTEPWNAHDAGQPVALPSHEKVAELAYLTWERNGYPEGTSLEDWLSAEQTLIHHRNAFIHVEPKDLADPKSVEVPERPVV